MTSSEQLMDRASAGGVRVSWADLHGRSGIYHDDLREIVLDVCLTDYQTRSVMAHELSHAHHRDRPTVSRQEHERRERRADADAARTLIAPDEYAFAEEMVGPDPGALAVELGVCRWVVEAFQREASHGRGWTCAQ